MGRRLVMAQADLVWNQRELTSRHCCLRQASHRYLPNVPKLDIMSIEKKIRYLAVLLVQDHGGAATQRL